VTCYVPLLLTKPGRTAADTKSYLYLNPGRLLERASSMWDPNVGFGTVTHQNIGYLWPMGPFFWSFERLGFPDWLAQRVWLGSVLFLAGLGVGYLLRTLGQHGPAVAGSMFVYALSPFVLNLGLRHSVLLLPYTGLPWLIGLTVRATRERTWRHPALFALVVTTVGSVNATALVLPGLGPLLWFPFAIFMRRELTPVQAIRTIGRIGSLTLLASLWWIAGLYCQAGYGLDVLRYTETARTVANASSAPELLRGLGYWFFYGQDKLGPLSEPAPPFMTNPALIAVTFVLPILGLVAAGVVRWRYRAYFVGLIVVGVVVGVGAHPWNHPSIAGRGFKVFLLSNLGLALRSLPRAAPLSLLGLAVLLGTAISALGPTLVRLVRPLTLGVAAVAVLGLPPLWTGGLVADNLSRPESIPSYWSEAAGYLDRHDRSRTGWDTRVLEVPGSDFATYRWGETVDPVTPGLMDRPYVARELIPYGTPASADLLNALDHQIQDGSLDPAALAPVARLMGVGDVVLRSDLAYERYNLPRPRQMWDLLRRVPDLDRPVGFGGDAPNRPAPALPLLDELELASDPDLPDPPKVAVFAVADPEPIIRAVSAEHPVLLAGDGDGLVNAAAAGLVTAEAPLFYAADLADTPSTFRRELDRAGARLVVTDSNRRAARRWGIVRDTNGLTERVGEKPLKDDPADNRLPVFPGAGDDSFTVVEHRGGVSAAATDYGNPVSYTPEDRAANAVDPDPDTAWTVGGFSAVDGERLELTYAEPRATSRVTLTQPHSGIQNRWITKVRLRFDGGAPVDIELSPASRASPGQEVSFEPRRFRRLSLEIRATDVGRRDTYEGLSSVGFADVRLGNGDVRLDEVVRLPVDLLDAAGPESVDKPLDVLLTRLRSQPTSALRLDEEAALARSFALPTPRRFITEGQVRLSTQAPDAVIDRLVGIRTAQQGGIDASSSRRLPGDIRARAVSAIDGDPATHWSPGFLGQVGEFVRYRSARSVSFDRMNLQVVNDGRHSVPTRIRVEVDGKPAATVAVPAVADQARRDGTEAVQLTFPPISGRDITFIVDAVREVRTIDWVSRSAVTMPVGIAELGVPGLQAEVPTGPFDSGCRSDLLRVGSTAVAVRVRGIDALRGTAMELTACGPALTLAAGANLLRSTPGATTGLDVDRVLLRSDEGGAIPRSFRRSEVAQGDNARQAATPVAATVIDEGRDKATVEVGARRGPTWLVLGQSLSPGWHATVDGRDLGPPTLVNGYANGWLLPQGVAPARVVLRWTPQRVVWVSMVISAVTVLGCLAGIGFGRRRRRTACDATIATADEQPAPLAMGALWQSTGAPPSMRATVVATAGFLIGGFLLVGPIAAIVVGAATLAALHWRHARATTALAPAVALAVSALYTIATQVKNRFPPGFEWPRYFGEVHDVALAGVLLLLADLAVDRLWTGRWWRRTDAVATTDRPSHG